MNINNWIKTLAMASLVTGMGIIIVAQDTRPVYADNHMQKMTVEADMELEWRRDDQQYIARGNAVITTRDMIFHADTITAQYEKDTDTGNNRIMLMTGDGQAKVVHLDEQGQENMRGIADRITYDRTSDIVTLTRQSPTSIIRVTRGSDISEADKSIIYDRSKGIITSTGNAVTTLADGRHMRGNQAVTTFKDDGKTINTIVINGNVIITQPMPEGGTQQATGQKAVYDAGLDIVTVTGDVVLTQQDNIIKGGTAIMKIGDGQSVVTSDENTGRVSGQFFIEDDGKE